MTIARTAAERDEIRKAALAKPRRRRGPCKHEWVGWSSTGALCTVLRRDCRKCGKIQTRNTS